jgi:hypothetical protein
MDRPIILHFDDLNASVSILDSEFARDDGSFSLEKLLGIVKEEYAAFGHDTRHHQLGYLLNKEMILINTERGLSTFMKMAINKLIVTIQTGDFRKRTLDVTTAPDLESVTGGSIQVYSDKPPPPKKQNITNGYSSETLKQPFDSNRIANQPAPPPSPMLKTIIEDLGFIDFRPGQQQSIEATCSGRDSFLSLSTGGGKTLSFIVPALYLQRICIVVSPLKSLIYDQLRKLREWNIPSVHVPASDHPTHQSIMNRLRRNVKGDERDLRVVYVTPEKLAQSSAFNMLLKDLYDLGRIGLFAIDESHCMRLVQLV